MNELENLLTSQQFTEESILSISFNLILCMVLVSIVGWFYKKYSRSMGGKTHVGAILPLIGLTVFMVITVVKSSLALSLGLVGALSIVRFRTPIKEPEELGYLFLTIAIGLGLGAGFEMITIFVTTAILLYLYFVNPIKNSSKVDGEYTLILEVLNEKLQGASELIESRVIAFKLIRIETVDNKSNAYYNVSVADSFNLHQLIVDLKNFDSTADFNLIESGVNW